MQSRHHPLRRFQIDPEFHRKVKRAREVLSMARANNPKGKGLSLVPLEHQVPLDAVETFSDLQGFNQSWIKTHEEISMFLRFWDEERQMFSVDPDLALDLARTDIGEIPWEAVKLPYDCFFVSFGPILSQEKVFQNRKYRADGFYIHRFKESIIPEYADRDCMRITITTRLIDPTYEDALSFQPSFMSLTDPTYDFVLIGRSGDTMDEVFSDSIAANRIFEKARDLNNYENSLRMAEDIDLVDVFLSPESFFLNRFERGLPLIEEALPVIFNLILYLSHGPEIPPATYEPGVPEKLLKKIEATPSEKKRTRLREELDRLGYTKIRFIRDPLPKIESIPGSSGSEIRPHWRRGHWRLQRHGPKLSLIKLVWVRPTVIHKDRIEERQIGRIYEVAQEPRSEQGAP